MRVILLAAGSLAVWALIGCARGATPGPGAASVSEPAVAIEPVDEARPLVVVTRADWCPVCHRMEPVVKQAEERFRGRATFVFLDLTDDATEAQAARRAKGARVGDFYSSNGGRTGVVAVFGRDRAAPVLIRGDDPEAYGRAIEAAERSFSGAAP